LHRHHTSPTHEHISFIYFAKASTDEVRPGEGEKQDEIKWFTDEELDDPKYGIRENVRFYAKAALKELGASV